jgi:hypothetical protein
MDAIFLCRMTKGKAQSVGIEPGRNCRVARSIFTKCVEVGVRSENATKLARYSVVVDMGNRDTSSNDRRPIGWYQKSTPLEGIDILAVQLQQAGKPSRNSLVAFIACPTSITRAGR